MGRKKGRASIPKIKESVGVRVELGDDSEALMRAAFENADPRKKGAHGEFDGKGKPQGSSNQGKAPAKQIDLHGKTLEEAQDAVLTFFNRMIDDHLVHELTIRVITGKGLRSGPAGGVLGGEIHGFIRQKFAAYIKKIDSSPSDVKLGGVPLRGHFDVTLKKR